MNTTTFHGLSRSGNHAIIFWHLNNLSDKIVEVGYQSHASADNTVIFLNNLQYVSHADVRGIVGLYKNLIVSYEDYKLIPEAINITRDFVNLICSRYKKWNNQLGYITSLDKVISLWKECATSDKSIYYNHWVKSHTYRTSVAENMLGITNKDITRGVSSIGDGSSFSGLKLESNLAKYFERYKQIKLPESWIDKILSDKELIRINQEIFNIDIEVCLT